jgi:hypothetical protein
MATNYTIQVRMSWDTTNDFDLYCRCAGGGDTCYYRTLPGYVSYPPFSISLNKDAYLGCDVIPGPEIMTITGSDMGDFILWWNRYSSCGIADPPLPTFDISVTNDGDEQIDVLLDSIFFCNVNAGSSSEWISINGTLDRAGSGEQDDYLGGNVLSVVTGFESSSESSDSSISSTSSSSSTSSNSSSSTSSQSTGFLADQYTAYNFSLFRVNGCYQRLGTSHNGYPVYSNGKYQLKYGGDHFARWYLENIEHLAVHYVAEINTDPTNDYKDYTPFLFWLGDGGVIFPGCADVESQSSQSLSSFSSYSLTSKSSISSYSDVSLDFSESSASKSSQSLSSESLSSISSFSSFYKNLPYDLVSYVSTCKGNSAVTNPAKGKSVGMIVEGCLEHQEIPEDESMIDKGGLSITTQNNGKIYCLDASKLFSASSGMLSITLRFSQAIINGVYSPLFGKDNSANPDMTIFVVNPGDFYFSPPGIYAALTPIGIEFSVWSIGNKITILDKKTTIEPDADVSFVFAWDYARRMTNDGDRISVAIFVDGEITASSPDPIVQGGFNNLFQFGKTNTEEDSIDDVVPFSAPFYLGNTPSGKNGLIGVIIRRFEIYSEPCLIATEATHSIVVLDKYPNSTGDSQIGFTVSATRNINVLINEPQFKPSISTLVNLLDIGTGLSYNEFGTDLGQMEDDTYPETPTGLPIGIEEVVGR